MSFTPTDEQQAAIDLFRTGDNVVIEAAAGTGKTSTLRQLADVNPNARGLYLAFNKAIATEAEQKFAGTNVVAKTAHSLAYRDFGAPMRDRMNAPRMRAGDKADIMGLGRGAMIVDTGSYDETPVRIARGIAARVVEETVVNFCRTDATEISRDHVKAPDTYMMTDAQQAALAALIVPYARRTWEDATDPNGRLPYKHDYYLKQWAMSAPQLGFDYILFDEAQDADPLMTAVVANQNSQVVAVGDSAQAIYGWRGAVDSMRAFGGTHTRLTQSFRFGAAIADFANEWLEILGTDMRVRGHDGPSSAHRTTRRLPEAVLCRTNGGVIGEVIAMFDAAPGRRIAIGGKNRAQELRRMAEAAKQLQEKHFTYHPDFETFKSWSEVVDYCAEDDGADIKPMVDLIERHSADFLINAIDRCVDVAQADTVISTAHTAKGLEWYHVRISDDFRAPKKDQDGNAGPMLPSDAMLAYVASTRAQRHLDNSGFDWLPAWKRERRIATSFQRTLVAA